MNQFKQAAHRAIDIYRVSHDKEKVARFISSEFNLAAYVSRGKVWATGTNEDNNKYESQVIFV